MCGFFGGVATTSRFGVSGKQKEISVKIYLSAPGRVGKDKFLVFTRAKNISGGVV